MHHIPLFGAGGFHGIKTLLFILYFSELGGRYPFIFFKYPPEGRITVISHTDSYILDTRLTF